MVMICYTATYPQHAPIGVLMVMILLILLKFGFGGIMGVCTGVALKRIGKGVAALVGTYEGNTVIIVQ